MPLGIDFSFSFFFFACCHQVSLIFEKSDELKIKVTKDTELIKMIWYWFFIIEETLSFWGTLLDWVLSDLCANPTGQGSNEPLGRNLPLRLIA